MASTPITRRRFLRFAALTASVGLLTACAQPSSAPATSAPAAPAAAPTSAPAAAAPTSAPAAAATTGPAVAATPANTLTFLWGSDTDKLDPPAMTAQEGFI